MILGTKSDLGNVVAGQNRNLIENIRNKFNIDLYQEVSAATGKNINSALEKFVEQITKNCPIRNSLKRPSSSVVDSSSACMFNCKC